MLPFPGNILEPKDRRAMLPSGSTQARKLVRSSFVIVSLIVEFEYRAD